MVACTNMLWASGKLYVATTCCVVGDGRYTNYRGAEGDHTMLVNIVKSPTESNTLSVLGATGLLFAE